MTAAREDSLLEWAARHFEDHPRQWRLPGDLARALDAKTGTSPALEIIDRELVKLADHAVPADALAIFCPPQEGKSERASRRFPEWLLGHDPSIRVAIVSYDGDLAIRWGRQIKRDVTGAPRKLLDVRIMPDSSAAGRWDTPEGGGVTCVGIGGALTGKPVDVLPVLVIDDPVKDREQAESQVYRDRAWDWWESVAIPRLAPGGIVVLIQCIVASMRVLTGEGRWVKVEDIRPGDTVVSLDEARTGLRTAKVTAARQSGTDETLRVETDRLTLEVNDRHPFAVLRPAEGRSQPRARPRTRPRADDVTWVRAADLKPGDVVVTAKSLPGDYQAADVLPDGQPVDTGLAWLLGYLTGDGWVTMHARINQRGAPVSYAVCCARTKSSLPESRPGRAG